MRPRRLVLNAAVIVAMALPASVVTYIAVTVLAGRSQPQVTTTAGLSARHPNHGTFCSIVQQPPLALVSAVVQNRHGYGWIFEDALRGISESAPSALAPQTQLLAGSARRHLYPSAAVTAASYDVTSYVNASCHGHARI